ncbi:MAG: hypothetical protein KC478_02410 [Bacteriovoracaceae bacterium]|nr:hypothetical protein [Bacteriovoracaceae bacterium]
MKNLLFLSLLLSLNSYAASNYSKAQERIGRAVKGSSFLEEFILGLNDQGQKIKGVKFIGKGEDKDKVSHLVVAAHHGNETKSVELALQFIDYLRTTNGKDFNNIDLYVIPVLNIGGYDREDRHERDSKNKSHDPNRDYPDPCIVKKNFKLKSTELLASFVRARNITGAITVHGYYGSLTYPWGIYTDNYETLDHKVFEKKAKDAVLENNYIVGTHADILYPAGGAFEDWAYFELGVWSLLVELEDTPKYADDIKMLVSSIQSFPSKRSRDHRHTGSCERRKDAGISRP